MGLDNPIHIAFLLILLLLVFGAKRLPEMGRSLGSGMRGFKDAVSGEEHSSASSAAVHQPVAVAEPALAVVVDEPVVAAATTSSSPSVLHATADRLPA